MRIVFMGTPAFAVPSLRVLAAQFQVVGVVTQPDAPSGRGRELTPSAVKRAALGMGLPVLQPPSLKDPAALAELTALRPDLIAVAAFGQILRRAVLDLPPLGCLNVHASLLPRWRGASPVPAAIAAGDPMTGVTIMKMDAGLDTGPIVSQQSMPIFDDDTTGTLLERLAVAGAALLAETLPAWERGALRAEPQEASQATTCGLIRKDDGRMDWNRPAAALERHARAMMPWPGAWTTWEGRMVRILKARPTAAVVSGAPGTVVALGKTAVGVVCGEGALELVDAQLEAKRPMGAADLARGQRGFLGGRLI